MSSLDERSPFGIYYCINPDCPQRENPKSLQHCQACGTSLLINQRYKAVLQSDFLALGRTFVHLLTGKHPESFLTDATGKSIWRDSAPNVSRWLADLIDDLMATLPENRPQNTQVIFKRLSARGLNLTETEKSIKLQFKTFNKRSLLRILLTSVAATSVLMGMRWFGILQSLELQAYDHFMRSRPAEPPDSRILIVGIDEKDIRKYGNKLIIDKDSVSVTGGKLSLPGERKFTALDLQEIETVDAALAFDFNQNQAKLQGLFKVPTFNDFQLDLTGDKYIAVKDTDNGLQFAMAADFSISEIPIFEDWKLENVEVKANKPFNGAGSVADKADLKT